MWTRDTWNQLGGFEMYVSREIPSYFCERNHSIPRQDKFFIQLILLNGVAFMVQMHHRREILIERKRWLLKQGKELRDN